VKRTTTFSYKLTRNDARRIHEIKSRIGLSKAAFRKKKKGLFTRKFHLNFRKKLADCYIWVTALYGAENWTLRKAAQKYLESFKVVLEKAEEDQLDRSYEKLRNITESQGEENVLRTVHRGKSKWIGHILRSSCLLKDVIEGKMGEGDSERKKTWGRRE
jgi:hypothetical protein